MPDFGNVFSSLGAHPLIVLLVFAVVTAAVLSVLSGGRLGEAIGGMFRVFLTIFTTPFLFLRDVLTTIRTSGEEEQHYERTRVFMLFRSNRIFYLFILVACLFVMAAGATSAVLALYPQYEIERGRALSAEITQIHADIVTVEGEVAAAGSPGARQTLETRRNEANAAYQQQVQSNLTFVTTSPYASPLIDQLARARNQQSVERLAGQIDSYMMSCPRNSYQWQGYTAAMCGQHRTFAYALADRRSAEFRLAQAAQEAQAAFNNTDMAAQNAAARLAELQTRLGVASQQRDEASLLNPRWLIDRGGTAIGILITSALLIVITVWIGALLIDYYNWIILMMRSLEKWATERVEGGLPSFRNSPDFQRGPPDSRVGPYDPDRS